VVDLNSHAGSDAGLAVLGVGVAARWCCYVCDKVAVGWLWWSV
jgi:hypothetical protein